MALLFTLIRDFQSVLISISVGLISLFVFYVIKFYINVKKYPPGPLPLPLIELKGKWTHEACIEFKEKYGPVFTIWMGPQPVVICATNETILEAYHERKNDFAGRAHFLAMDMFKITPDSKDVFMTDWSKEWEVLRRVIHTATRKVAVSPTLPKTEITIIDEVINLIKKKEGLHSAFDPNPYLYLIVYSILASTAAGKSYSVEDPEFVALKDASEVQLRENKLILMVEFLPLLKTIRRKKWLQLEQTAKLQLHWCQKLLKDHKSTYRSNEIRDVCDAILHSKEEARESDAWAVGALTDDNLTNSLNNFFQAGSDTTRITLHWTILILCKFPQLQKRLKEEIQEVIGDEIPTNDHRMKCHYVQAFIAEVLRFKPVFPLGGPHKAICDSTIGGFAVPKGTMVVALIYNQLNDPKIWDKPEEFKPERFLDASGSFNNRPNNSNHPFSVGRRSCIGEKLAVVNLFIILTRLLQNVTFELSGEATLDPDPVQLAILFPTTYKIKL